MNVSSNAPEKEESPVVVPSKTIVSTQIDLAMNSKEGKITALLIQPSRGWASLDLRDLWEYRELIYFLVVREIQGVYRQTALGMSWLFIRPIVNMLLLTFVFSSLLKVQSDNVPYPLFSLAALIPWGYFSNAVMRTSRSLVDNTQVISKVYFPRMILPLAGAISGLVDMMAALIVFMLAFILYKMPLRVEMLWLPCLALVAVAFALAVGLWLATLSVKYRDVSFAIVFILQAMMYLSPVIYPVSLVPSQFRFLYNLNPMTGVIQGFRWSLLGSGDLPGIMLFLDILIILIALVSGAYIFRRTERTIVDIL
jgi:lipopolysaccharide transport system permease protein